MITHRNHTVILTVILIFLFSGTALTAPRMNDDTITAAVEEELLHDPVVEAFRIAVGCRDGVVELTGVAENILAKERSLNIAETVKGVRSVVNRIRVVPAGTRSDTIIRRDVIQALAGDPAVESYDIAVSVVDREVTLRGQTDSFREKELAGTVAKSVAGVEALDNQINLVYPDDRRDKDILADILAGLKWDLLVDHALIGVKVNDGQVTLSGTVGSAAEKTRANAVAWVTGVKAIDDGQLHVARWARDPDLRQGKYVSKTDEEIRQAVIAALKTDPRVSMENVLVTVADGTVTLRGTVDTLRARRAAAGDTVNTVGVYRYKNHLKVGEPEPGPSDSELEQRIEAALERDAYVDGYEVHVDVRSGVAALYGRVDTGFEKIRAEDVAGTLPGIFAVENNILVSKGWYPHYYNPYVDVTELETYTWYEYGRAPRTTLKSDREIKRSIEEELWWSPFVSSDRIDVRVDGGKAILKGEVTSKTEYDAATENAWEGGATAVDNDLVILGLLHPKKN